MSDDLVKLELETPLESGFTMTGCVGALLGVAALAHGAQHGFSRFDHVLGGLALAAAVLGFGGRALLSEYFLVDTTRALLLHCRRWAGWEQVSTVAPLSGLRLLAVQGRLQRSQYSSDWCYCVVALTQGGRRYRLTDEYKNEKGYEKSCLDAERLGALMGVAVHPPRPQSVLGTDLEYRDPPFDGWLIVLVSLILGSGLVGLILTARH